MSTTGRGLLVAALATTMLVPLAPVAVAHDHLVPAAVLEASGGKQRGLVTRAAWTRRSGPGCVVMDLDGVRRYPSALVHPPQEEVRLHLLKRQRPQHVTLRGFRFAAPGGEPVGPGEDISYSLERQGRGSGATWEIVFTPLVLGDLYIEAIVEWRDASGCGGGDQHVWWNFHLASA